MTRIALFTAAALAVSGMSFVGVGCDRTNGSSAYNTDSRTTGQKTADSVRSAGDKTADAAGNAADKTTGVGHEIAQKVRAATEPSNMQAETKDVDAILADVVDSALKVDGFNDVVSNFTKSDRERIGKVDKGAYADMNATIRQFQADWKAKYTQSFAPKSYKAAIYTDQFATVSPGSTAGEPVLAGSRLTPTTGSSVNTPDKDMAVVTVLTRNGGNKMNLQMVNEGTISSSWRIDVPDTVDASRLKDALQKQLTLVDNDKANWPTDVNDAYRLVSRHVLMAIADAGK